MRVIYSINKITILIFLFFNISFAQDTVKVATPEWVGQTNADGSGLYFDIIREVFRIEGISMEYSIVPWNRANIMLKDGRADIMCGRFDYEKGDFIIPRYPISYEITSVVYIKDKFRNFTKESLRNKRLLWSKGYSYHEEFEFDISYTEVQDTALGFRNLLNNRADFFLDNLFEIKHYLESHPLIKDKIEVNDLFENYIYITFSASQRGRKLSEIFDKNIEKLILNGEIKKMYAEYGIKYKELVPRN